MEELSPRTIVERSIQFWWFIVLAMLAGGLTAYLIHTTRPPVYEARAVFSVSLDYTQTGKLDLTEEDIALATAANLVISAPVVQEVIAAAQAQNLPVDQAYINQHFRYERKNEAWELAIRDSDPQLAARVVNIWATAGLKALDEASLHAQQAATLRRYIASLTDCLQRSTAATEAPVPCAAISLEGLQSELAGSGAALQAEIAASKGFNPAVRYALLQTAGIPMAPTRLGANSMMLAGMLAGLIVGVWAVQTSLPSRLRPRLERVRRHA